MAGLTPAHLILILVIALIVIGPGKLPETGAALGKALRSFKDATNGIGEDDAQARPIAPATPIAPAAAAQDGTTDQTGS